MSKLQPAPEGRHVCRYHGEPSSLQGSGMFVGSHGEPSSLQRSGMFVGSHGEPSSLQRSGMFVRSHGQPAPLQRSGMFFQRSRRSLWESRDGRDYWEPPAFRDPIRCIILTQVEAARGELTWPDFSIWPCQLFPETKGV